MAILFSVLVTILILGWLWFYIARPILEDYGVIGPRVVNTYQPVDRSENRVMSRQEDQTGRQTKQTEQTDADQWIERIQLDRTKTALIELLVYSGWQVGEIRGVLKGDSGAIGNEVEAARQRLGIASPDQYRTPIANRPTKAVFESDPELAYQPPDA